jgi:hypothetical protein
MRTKSTMCIMGMIGFSPLKFPIGAVLVQWGVERDKESWAEAHNSLFFMVRQEGIEPPTR